MGRLGYLAWMGALGGGSVAWGGSFSCVLEPLYWKANGERLECIEQVSTSRGLRGTLESLDFDWDWGFQVGFGYRLPHDAWQVSLGLKHIHTNAHGGEESETGRTLLPLWHTPGASIGEINRSEAHWRLHLGLLDALISRSWCLTSHFNAIFCCGLRTGWIRQKYQIGYFEKDSLGTHLSMKNKFWGLGPAFGGQINWKMTSHLSIFGELLFSILYGTFYVHQAEWEVVSKEDLLGIHKSFKSSQATLDMGLGLRWERARADGTPKWALEIAWDQVVLPGQSQWIRWVSSTAHAAFASNQGYLSLEGLRFGGRLHF